MNQKTTAIVFQGLQIDFCSPEGKLHGLIAEQLTSRRLIPKMIEFLDKAAQSGVQIYFVPIIFTPDYRELRNVGGVLESIKNAGAFQAGTRGAETIDELLPLLDRITVISAKRGLCAFGSTDLDEQLRRNGIDTVVVCGLLTNVCVETTARSAYDLGYRVITISDLTATKSADEQSASERFIFPLLGHVMTASEFWEEIQSKSEEV